MTIQLVKSWIKSFQSEIIIVFIWIAIFIIIGIFGQPTRVGDGSEYYALALAWRHTGRPYMTDISWNDYDQLYNSNEIIGLPDGNRLKHRFPQIANETQADFNHFWFYGFCAAIISKVVSLVGIQIPIHQAFLVLHCLLLAAMFMVAKRNFGRRGLFAVAILTFLSPIIWYFDKVHTELFTFCLTTIAVIFFLRRSYFSSAFFLALTSTQNISFAGISAFVIIVGLFDHKGSEYSIVDVVKLVLSTGSLALHPAYYFFRWGVLSPQFTAGGAKTGLNLKYAYVWFLDPDVGLFPNWPLGIIIFMLTFIVVYRRKINRLSVNRWLIFVLFYIGISIIAQSSTTNLNSGATPGLARYSLWYLALFFPSILLIIEKLFSTRWLLILFVLSMIFQVIYSYIYFRPTLSENYNSPSPASFWIQKNLPMIYNPPIEIFDERYGIGEHAKLPNTLVVIGPDCNKTLIENINLDEDLLLTGNQECGFDMSTLSQIIKSNLSNGRWRHVNPPAYVRLTNDEVKSAKLRVGKWYPFTSTYPFIGFALDKGEWRVNTQGTWSIGNEAGFSIPCNLVDSISSEALEFHLKIKPFIANKHPNIKTQIYVNNPSCYLAMG